MLAYLQIFADKEELLTPFSDAERGRLLTAMLTYALHDEEIALEGNERYIWPVFKQMIDQSKDALSKKQNAGRARQEAASTEQHTAAPVSTSQHTVAEASTSQQEAAEAPIIKESRIKNQESILKNHDNKGVKAKKQSFSAPTPEMVRDYCNQMGITGVDAQKFVDYYASKGWLVGRSPMQDWYAAVRNWSKNGFDQQAGKTRKVNAQNYTQRKYTEDELGGDALRKLLAEMKADQCENDQGGTS